MRERKKKKVNADKQVLMECSDKEGDYMFGSEEEPKKYARTGEGEDLTRIIGT